MPLSSADRIVRENTSAVYEATLKDEDGVVIAVGDLTSMTLTLRNDLDGTIINSRNQQTIINTNNVTISSSGLLTWVMQPEDNAIIGTEVRPGQYEQHYALFEWVWDTTKKGNYEVRIDVLCVDEVPLFGGTTIISSWGGGTSNSYVSYTAANSFVVYGIVNHSAWDDASATQRAAALIEATRDIDSKQYIFTKYLSTQALEFPRSVRSQWPDSVGAWSATALSALQTRQQSDVEKACSHQALFILQQNEKTKHQSLREAGVSSARRKLGPIEEEFRYSPIGSTDDAKMAGSSVSPLCKQALGLLSDWMTSRKVYRG